jgi:hypothetical protein
MLSLLAAKHIGDMLSTGLYDSLVIDNDLPMLPETLSQIGISAICPVSGSSSLSLSSHRTDRIHVQACGLLERDRESWGCDRDSPGTAHPLLVALTHRIPDHNT